MNLDDCRNQAERDVIVTYRRHLRRKGATPFSAQGSALTEELAHGTGLSPEFVERFSSPDGVRENATRTLDQGRLRLTRKGRAVLEDLAGIGTDENEWHYWSPIGDYVRSACGLVRDRLDKGQDVPPPGGKVCSTCSTVSTVEREILQ